MLFYLAYLVSLSASVLSGIIHTNDNGSEDVQGRIVGGKKPDIFFIDDYQVQLITHGDMLCGGFIINEYYIVTAAHCVDNTKPDDIYARAGTVKFNEGGIVVTIVKIVLHPEYDPPDLNYDVAYLRTKAPFDFSLFSGFGYGVLDEVGTELPREVAVSGFGSPGNGEPYSENLLAVNLTVIHNLRCQIMYPELSITKNMFCAENTRDGGQGACKGDAGNAAIRTPYYLRELVGISSFTRGCGPGMGPSVFTRLGAREIHDFIINGTRLKRPKETHP